MPRGPDELRLSEINIRLKQKQTKSYSSFESECYYVAVMSLCLLYYIILSSCGVEFPLSLLYIVGQSD